MGKGSLKMPPMCPYGENIGATSRKISIMIANTGF